jgi:hypothetical protein
MALMEASRPTNSGTMDFGNITTSLNDIIGRVMGSGDFLPSKLKVGIDSSEG